MGYVLQVVASGNIQWSSLLETNFAAAPQSIPIIALSFVYQVILLTIFTLNKLIFLVLD
jgi:tyrosine-specific transport protein